MGVTPGAEKMRAQYQFDWTRAFVKPPMQVVLIQTTTVEVAYPEHRGQTPPLWPHLPAVTLSPHHAS